MTTSRDKKTIRTINKNGVTIYPKNQTSTLEKIESADVNHLIVSYLKENKQTEVGGDIKTSASFVQTSKTTLLSNFFKIKILVPEYEKHKNQIKALCQAVVYGDYNKVKAILDKNPGLVRYKARVQDYSFHETNELDEKGNKKRIYRESEGTALQLALAAEDVSRWGHPDEGITNLILSYFTKAFHQDEKTAQAEILKQQEEQFPGGYQAYETSDEVKKKKKSDLKALQDVIAAIQKADVQFTTNGNYDDSKGEVKVDAKCEAALNRFKEYLKPQGIIRQGKHFNIELLYEALQAYYNKERFDAFSGDVYNSNDSPKNVLMWRKVVGYIQRYLPACFAQALCQGLDSVVGKNQKLNRSLSFYYDDDLLFFPLDSPSKFGLDHRLGYQYAANANCATEARKWSCAEDQATGNYWRRPLGTYIIAKDLACQSILQVHSKCCSEKRSFWSNLVTPNVIIRCDVRL
jgi:hypothetical protein